jgi:hypothetical protein
MKGSLMKKPGKMSKKKLHIYLELAFFSIFWIAGIGSIISIVLWLKARNIIKRANMNIKGMGVVYWCLIIGVLGVIISLLIIIAIIITIIAKSIYK